MSSNRGITLFNDLIDIAEPEKQRKGRSENLYSLRNDCLLDRFYFYGKYTTNRYDVILETLSMEFFLSKVTIPKVIDDNYEKLAEIKKQYRELTEQKVKIQLQKKWPHLVWA